MTKLFVQSREFFRFLINFPILIWISFEFLGLSGPIWVKDWRMKRLCITNDSEQRSRKLSVRPTFLRPMWKNQSEWVEKGLENRPNRQIQPKGCTISAKKKPIHPSEKANSKKIRQITAAAKKQTSLLQLLSEYHGKFILLENKIIIIWFFLLSHWNDEYVMGSIWYEIIGVSDLAFKSE